MNRSERDAIRRLIDARVRATVKLPPDQKRYDYPPREIYRLSYPLLSLPFNAPEPH